MNPKVGVTTLYIGKNHAPPEPLLQGPATQSGPTRSGIRNTMRNEPGERGSLPWHRPLLLLLSQVRQSPHRLSHSQCLQPLRKQPRYVWLCPLTELHQAPAHVSDIREAFWLSLHLPSHRKGGKIIFMYQGGGISVYPQSVFPECGESRGVPMSPIQSCYPAQAKWNFWSNMSRVCP
jgi:hypothetical protein